MIATWGIIIMQILAVLFDANEKMLELERKRVYAYRTGENKNQDGHHNYVTEAPLFGIYDNIA